MHLMVRTGFILYDTCKLPGALHLDTLHLKKTIFRDTLFSQKKTDFHQKQKQNDQLLVKVRKWQQSRATHPVNPALPMAHNNNQDIHAEKLQSISLRTLQ